MKANFKITRTSEGVFAKEVNPETCPNCGGDGTDVDYTSGCCGSANEDGSCCNQPILVPILAQCSRCRATGRLELQEYPLTYGSKLLLEIQGYCKIGQLISGEIVMEDGIKKIKI